MTWDNRLTFEVSSADPDSPTPVWVDLTTRIRDAIQPVTTQSGRQNDLDQSEPGRLDALLDNSDDALTYGAVASPYPWWGPGRKCRLRETVGGVTMDRFSGYLQVPTEVLITAPVDPADPHEQRVAITAVDRLGRLQSGEPFVSTLTEYIRSSYPGTLTRYWSLSGAGPYIDTVAGKTLTPEYRASGSLRSAILTPADGPVAPADDLKCPKFTPGTTDGYRLLSTDTNAPLSAGQVLTIVAWFLPTGTFVNSDDFLSATLIENVGSSSLAMFCSGPDSHFVVQLAFGALTGTIDTSAVMPVDVPTPIAIRYGYSPSVFEVWIGAQRVTGTLTGTPPTTSTVYQIIVGNLRYAGRIGHAQVHIGPAGAFDLPQFLAQQRMGLTGLERQTTGDRIRTILQYAGVPAAEMTQIDKGTSVMQRATLAGKDPLSAMRDAERTEQGLLYVDGSGNLVFRDRRSLYNI